MRRNGQPLRDGHRRRDLLLALLVAACGVAPCGGNSGGAGRGAAAPLGDRGRWRPPPATFNGVGVVSPFAALPKTPLGPQASTGKAAPRSSGSGSGSAEETPTLEWSQTEEVVTLTVWVPQLVASSVRVMLSVATLQFSATSKTGQVFKLDFDQLGE